MNQKLNLDNAVFGFVIYQNPNTQIKYLLFRGIGFVKNNKYERIEKYDYLTSSYGYKKLRNYYDMFEKFGDKPCVVLDVDNNLISDIYFKNQNEIAEIFEIKVSRLSKKPFCEKEVANTKKLRWYIVHLFS